MVIGKSGKAPAQRIPVPSVKNRNTAGAFTHDDMLHALQGMDPCLQKIRLFYAHGTHICPEPYPPRRFMHYLKSHTCTLSPSKHCTLSV
jgi:hypothetical protein